MTDSTLKVDPVNRNGKGDRLTPQAQHEHTAKSALMQQYLDSLYQVRDHSPTTSSPVNLQANKDADQNYVHNTTTVKKTIAASEIGSSQSANERTKSLSEGDQQYVRLAGLTGKITDLKELSEGSSPEIKDTNVSAGDVSVEVKRGPDGRILDYKDANITYHSDGSVKTLEDRSTNIIYTWDVTDKDHPKGTATDKKTGNTIFEFKSWKINGTELQLELSDGTEVHTFSKTETYKQSVASAENNRDPANNQKKQLFVDARGNITHIIPGPSPGDPSIEAIYNAQDKKAIIKRGNLAILFQNGKYVGFENVDKGVPDIADYRNIAKQIGVHLDGDAIDPNNPPQFFLHGDGSFGTPAGTYIGSTYTTKDGARETATISNDGDKVVIKGGVGSSANVGVTTNGTVTNYNSAIPFKQYDPQTGKSSGSNYVIDHDKTYITSPNKQQTVLNDSGSVKSSDFRGNEVFSVSPRGTISIAAGYRMGPNGEITGNDGSSASYSTSAIESLNALGDSISDGTAADINQALTCLDSNSTDCLESILIDDACKLRSLAAAATGAHNLSLAESLLARAQLAEGAIDAIKAAKKKQQEGPLDQEEKTVGVSLSDRLDTTRLLEGKCETSDARQSEWILSARSLGDEVILSAPEEFTLNEQQHAYRFLDALLLSSQSLAATESKPEKQVDGATYVPTSSLQAPLYLPAAVSPDAALGELPSYQSNDMSQIAKELFRNLKNLNRLDPSDGLVADPALANLNESREESGGQTYLSDPGLPSGLDGQNADLVINTIDKADAGQGTLPKSPISAFTFPRTDLTESIASSPEQLGEEMIQRRETDEGQLVTTFASHGADVMPSTLVPAIFLEGDILFGSRKDSTFGTVSQRAGRPESSNQKAAVRKRYDQVYFLSPEQSKAKTG